MGIRPVKTGWLGAGMVVCLQQGADLHMVQLIPLPLTVSCFSKIQMGFTFLVPAHPGSPGKKPLHVCVCVFGLLEQKQGIRLVINRLWVQLSARKRKMRQGNSSGQVAHTHVLLSPSSIIWCREVQCRLKTSEDIGYTSSTVTVDRPSRSHVARDPLLTCCRDV